MFQGHGGLTLDGDHLDISYRDEADWPKLTEKGSLRAIIFGIGDEEAGPGIQLGLITEREDEPLDWRHSIDPLHHHGSDQFRAILHGRWNLAGRRLSAGDFSFQQAGMVYQEHPAAPEAWMMLVMADRRGNQATIARKRDEATIFEYDEIYGAPTAGRPYPHPAGDRGVTAVATTAGGCTNGFLNGSGTTLDEGTGLTGLLGDAQAGPAIHLLRIAAGAPVMPASQWATEIVIAVTAGTLAIDGRTYRPGELRVQRAAVALPAPVAGAAGAEIVLLRGDRRAPATFADAAPLWYAAAGRLAHGLNPVPGGPPERHSPDAARG